LVLRSFSSALSGVPLLPVRSLAWTKQQPPIPVWLRRQLRDASGAWQKKKLPCRYEVDSYSPTHPAEHYTLQPPARLSVRVQTLPAFTATVRWEPLAPPYSGCLNMGFPLLQSLYVVTVPAHREVHMPTVGLPCIAFLRIAAGQLTCLGHTAFSSSSCRSFHPSVYFKLTFQFRGGSFLVCSIAQWYTWSITSMSTRLV
jgi:hypothetical protein